MCGSCGVTRTDWLTGVLSGSYARTVVAARLSTLRPGVRVTAGPAGWSLRSAGRTDFYPALPALLSALGPVPGPATLAAEWPDHRPVPLPDLPGHQPTRVLNELVGQALARSAGEDGS
ncbi:hypothetical protein [Amycolatopsis sp. WGS_07]|uniref:hypothetical protein n=1 Tax=Amycolatopsis sp. WGS_07 TaxID=3076764 RepID=UPI00387343DE